MTAARPMAPLADSSLAALNFVEAVIEGNTVNWQHALITTGRNDLLVGLANVAAKLASALAVKSNCSIDDVFEVHRSLFLLMGGE